MKRCISSSRRGTVTIFAAMVLAASGSVFAQSVDQVLQAEQRRLTLAQQSQERINTVVERTRSLEDQYRAINKEIDGLRVYNRLMVAQTDGQGARHFILPVSPPVIPLILERSKSVESQE